MMKSSFLDMESSFLSLGMESSFLSLGSLGGKLLGKLKPSLPANASGPPIFDDNFSRLLPAPETPYAHALPATKSGVMSKLAKLKADDAWYAAEDARRSEDDAYWYAHDAQVKEGEAYAARTNAVNWDSIDSMVKTLNSLLRQESAAGLGDPVEVNLARHMLTTARRAARSGKLPLKLLLSINDDGGEVTSVLSGSLIEDIKKAAASMDDQQKQAEQVEDIAGHHRDFMELLGKREPIARLPKELLRPDGEPWWPQPVPRPTLPARQIMVAPAAGANFL